MKLLLAIALSAPAAFAQSRPAMQLEDVLLTEAYSEIDRRKSLASSRVEDASPGTWWQSGYIRTHDGWANYEDAVRHLRGRPEQAEYQRLSEIAPPGVKGHLLLAKWCLRNDRLDQYRAHMLAAFKMDSSLASIDQLLKMGFVRVHGQWLSPETAYEVTKQRHAIDKSLSKWGEICRQIRIGLNGSKTEVAAAEQQLAEISSPDAVMAIDNELGRGDAKCHRLVVETLRRINSATSTLTLAKYAVFSQASTARTAAMDALRKRPLSHFVPALLGLLRTKARIEVVDTRLSVHGLATTVKVVRETQNQRHIQVLESVSSVRFVSHDESNPETADFRWMGTAVQKQALTKLSRLRHGHLGYVEEAIWRKHRDADTNSQNLNQRVLPVLETVSGEDSDAPEYWWAWWNQYTDVEAPIKNEVLEVEQRRIESGQTFSVAVSCFVAGTQVLTDTGRRPIETLKIGDRVLSQDIDTGELRFRVVEQTTVRPTHASMAVEFGSDAIRCTGGHNFWKAGEGWVKARDLETGDRIRTPTGTVAVTGTTDARPAKTYNLVVEGFHTYFVGKSALLVQDVLPPAATDMVLPGLSRFELEE